MNIDKLPKRTRKALPSEMIFATHNEFYTPRFIGVDYFTKRGLDYKRFYEEMPVSHRFLMRVPVVSFAFELTSECSSSRYFIAAPFVDRFYNHFLSPDERGSFRIRAYFIDEKYPSPFRLEAGLRTDEGFLLAHAKDLGDDEITDKLIGSSLFLRQVEEDHIVFRIGTRIHILLWAFGERYKRSGLSSENYASEIFDRYGDRLQLHRVEPSSGLGDDELEPVGKKYKHIREVFNLSYAEIQEDFSRLNFLAQKVKRK